MEFEGSRRSHPLPPPLERGDDFDSKFNWILFFFFFFWNFVLKRGSLLSIIILMFYEPKQEAIINLIVHIEKRLYKEQ